MRRAEIERKTRETDILLSLELDGSGSFDIDSGCGFLDHMLSLLACHGGFDLKLRCKGDTQVDFHHSVEDTGLVLGKALRECLGDLRGINRYGYAVLPMDEALILSAIDISGRAHLSFDLSFPSEKIGSFDSELIKEFFLAFVRGAGVSLHIRKLSGDNSHHLAEAAFKAFTRSLRDAVSLCDGAEGKIPSSKGVL